MQMQPYAALAAAVLAGCGTTSSGSRGEAQAPTSDAALVDAISAALASRDAAAFSALLLPGELAADACPEAVEQLGREALIEKITERRQPAERAFAECAARFDWSRATPPLYEPGAPKSDSKCSGVQTWTNLIAMATVDGTELMFRADSPVEVAGRFYLSDGFECGLLDDVIEPTLGVDIE